MEGTRPDFGNAAHTGRMALAVLALVSDRAWVKRRTDRVHFATESQLVRRVRLEFALPHVPGFGDDGLSLSHMPVPLGLHYKTILAGLEIRDGSGNALSMLTKQEDHPIMLSMLGALAQLVLGATPSEYVLDLLRSVLGPPEEASKAIDALGEFDDGKRIASHGFVGALIKELVTDFYMLVLVPFEIGTQHIIEFSYEEHLQRQHPPRWLGDAARAIWPKSPGPFQLRFPVGEAASYHAEVVAPRDLSFPTVGEIVIWDLEGTVEHEAIAYQDVAVIYAASAARGDSAQMNAVFQTHVDGTNRVASIICVGASLLFLLPLIGRLLWHLSPSGDAAPAAAVLVAVPAVLAVVALRDDKHPVTGQYTARARTRVAWAGILSFVGGAILATQFHDPPSWLAEHGYGWRTLAWAVITLTLVGLAIITVAKRDRG